MAKKDFVARGSAWIPRASDDGKDAINIVFVPSEIVFNANDRGEIDNGQYQDNSAVIRVYRGSTELEYGEGGWTCTINDNNVGDNCNYYLVKESGLWKGRFKNITSTQLEGTEKPLYVPSSAGGGVFRIKVDGITYNAYLPFSVNVNTFANALIKDNKQYIQKYTEVSNKYTEVSKELDNKANKNDMEEKISTISQKADNIKLEVLSKTSGRRNMLVNSAFRNQDSVFIHSLARIEKNTGVDGVNCIHSSDKYSGTGDGNYIGAFWDSTQKNSVANIPIVNGKKYVISCWIKSDNLELPFAIECFFMNSINQQDRGDTSVREIYHVDNVNEWKRIVFILDTTKYKDATEYLAVNFWSNNKNVPKATGATEYPTCHAYICKPMMEDGDTYGGWTLSEDDYDYVGGNMIDNARTLEVGGSLTSINESNLSDYGLAYYGDSMSLRINNTNANSTHSIMTFKPSLDVGVDYMFSFLSKGTANIGLYALCDNSVDGDYLLSEDSVNADVRVIDTFRNRYASIILIPTQLTTEYNRYWGHMRFYGHVPTKLYLQLNHAGDVYICQPKLEIGATMTEFTERKTDLVDKASLKKAGIEITTDKVKLYGDKVQVLTRIDGTHGYEEAGMFSNGKLNANLIDAETIVVNGIQGNTIDAKNATISNLNVKNVLLSGSLRSPFTVVGDSFTTDYSDNAVMQVDNDGYSVNYSIPWNVEQAGRRICILSNLWGGEQVTGGSVSISIPDAAKDAGCRFFENGVAKTELNFSTEVLELMAYGDISARTESDTKSHYLYGWIVLNRIDLMTNFSYGRNKKLLAYGKVTGTSSGASIKYRTFDGSELSVNRIGTGEYNIIAPRKWFENEATGYFDLEAVFVNLTGIGYSYDDKNKISPIKATFWGATENIIWGYNDKDHICIEVRTSDDETVNDGSFNFEISNFNDFNT